MRRGIVEGGRVDGRGKCGKCGKWVRGVDSGGGSGSGSGRSGFGGDFGGSRGFGSYRIGDRWVIGFIELWAMGHGMGHGIDRETRTLIQPSRTTDSPYPHHKVVQIKQIKSTVYKPSPLACLLVPYSVMYVYM